MVALCVLCVVYAPNEIGANAFGACSAGSSD